LLLFFGGWGWSILINKDKTLDPAHVIKEPR